MLKRVVTENLTIGRKARMLGSSAVLLGDTSRVNTMLDEIRATKRKDLLRVANNHLTDEQAFECALHASAGTSTYSTLGV